jgi:DNA modification methylase
MSFELHHGDCAEVMRSFPDGCIDLTVTSPPYDNLRTYNGYSFDLESVARELYRVTARGGIVVWVVGDATIKGSETGTSFRQALHFQSLGFNLHDTMIYRKDGPPLSHNRYEQRFEYMFVLSKGKPKTFNPLREPSIHAGKKRTGTMRQKGDELSSRNAKGAVLETKVKGNVWDVVCANGGTRDAIAHKHPAIFPEQLAADHISSWSNLGDTVLDPFAGSGTTGKMAVLAHRRFIGIDISAEYLEIARKRIEAAKPAISVTRYALTDAERQDLSIDVHL